MREHQKQRDAASEALIALRTAMGKTQAQFAVTVLETAVTTIARYETSHPPQGELLLRLADIARQQRMYELQDVFRELYVKQVLRDLGFDLLTVPRTESEPEHGYLFKRLEGQHALSAAQSFILILAQLDSSDSETKANAVSAISSLREAARRFAPEIGDLQDALLSAMTGKQPQTSAKKRTKTGKPRTREDGKNDW
jgi:transcriptional regulator with XRE-family HTH domain